MESRGSRPATGIDPPPLEEWLSTSGALRAGHFLLSSGLHSPAYVQCALLLQEPSRARRLGAELARRLARFRADCVLSPALGGLIIGHEVAAALGVPFRFAEREGEGLALRRGFALRPGESVVIVEDVVTTGRSSVETARVAHRHGAEVRALGSILDRTGDRPALGFPFVRLLRLELPSYRPETCPLCVEGVDLDKPGSRPPAGSPSSGLCYDPPRP